MSKKLFVGGLAWATTDDSLKEAFEKFGPVVEAKVILDRETNRSRGFGFVTFTSDDDAKNAIEGLDGKELDGRQIRVNEAEDRGRGGGGGGNRGRGGGGGNRGGGGGGGPGGGGGWEDRGGGRGGRDRRGGGRGGRGRDRDY